MALRGVLPDSRSNIGGPSTTTSLISQNIAAFATAVRIQGQPDAVSRPAAFSQKIEVLVPCYNHAPYLESAFESVLQQTRKKPITVTFIDDCSDDDTATLIGHFTQRSKDNWLRVNALRNSTNLRQWASLNSAIQKSTNELFVILNDDDLLLPDCLEVIVNTYNANHDIYMLGSSCLLFETGKPRPHREQKPFRDLILRVHDPSETNAYRSLHDLSMTHTSCSFFRVAWEVAGGYFPKDRRIHPDATEDRDFEMRVAALFPVATYDDYPLACWRTDTSHGQHF